MDAIDILGAVLGKRSQSAGTGGNILKEILEGRRGGPTGSPPASTRTVERSPGRTSTQHRGNYPDGVESLEDLLREAHGHHRHRRSAPQAAPRPVPQSPPPPQPREEPRCSNDQAIALVQAMISAAKSDGRIDRTEQQTILEQFGDVSSAEARFLQEEFSRPVDVRALAWDVPLGQEQQVYALSLMAIELDENSEARYLHELAHGLRLSPDVCNQLHDRFGAPRIFR